MTIRNRHREVWEVMRGVSYLWRTCVFGLIKLNNKVLTCSYIHRGGLFGIWTWYYWCVFGLFPSSLITQTRRFESRLLSSSGAFETSCLCNQWRWKKSKYTSVISGSNPKQSTPVYIWTCKYPVIQFDQTERCALHVELCVGSLHYTSYEVRAFPPGRTSLC
jgi:hypothetical protein